MYRLLTPLERMLGQRDALLPPAHLRLYYYRTLERKAFDRACDGARTELLIRGLRPEHRILDIGSGIGNLAIGLSEYLRGTYDGIEIHPEAVSWCQRVITERYPQFRFHQANLLSHAYNPHGVMTPATYRFPFEDGRFDFVFLSSVFTHMLPDAVENYLREISRVLAPAGQCVASYFLLNDESRAGVDSGRSFMSFNVAHPSGLCRLHDDSIPEAAVAFEEAFVLKIHEDAGLNIADIRRGGWWAGTAHDHDVLTVRRVPDTRG
jgi:SAM-dependent methyltransferase